MDNPITTEIKICIGEEGRAQRWGMGYRCVKQFLYNDDLAQFGQKTQELTIDAKKKQNFT